MAKWVVYREILPTLYWVFFVQLFLIVASAPMTEMGDLRMFKLWANQAYAKGIHQAFVDPEFRYDWLPLYLYFSKAIGGFYAWSGLLDWAGPWSRALSVLLKCAMVCLHIFTGYLIYAVCRVFGQKKQEATWVCQLFVWQPGIVVATSLYGYQDAFHTVLIVGVLLCLFTEKQKWVYVLGSLVFLTKPQAVIYLLPLAGFGLRQYGWRWCVQGVCWGLGITVLVLSPFLIYGTLPSVFSMYTGVSNVHEWLTGCAHNFWWLVSSVPPFESDRLPLFFGFSGLQIGLSLFACLAGCLGWRLWRDQSPYVFVEICALLGFGFFMVVTEIHENHHYAVFAFLAPLVVYRASLRWIYYVLSATFVINLVTTKLWLETDVILALGPVRIETLNAIVNTVVFVAWLYLFFVQRLKTENHSVG